MRGNAICERIIGTLRWKLFDRLLIVNEHHLRRVLTEYLRHYNAARPHRALGQLAPVQAHTRPPEINLAEHRSADSKSSAGSRASTRSSPDSPKLLPEDAGHRHDRVFEPHSLPASPASSQAELPDYRLADRIKLAFQCREAFLLPAPRSREDIAHLLILPAASTANGARWFTRSSQGSPARSRNARPPRPGSRPTCLHHPPPTPAARRCLLRMTCRSGGPDEISGDRAWPSHNPSPRECPPV